MTGSAKQSRSQTDWLDCFVASAPRNDAGTIPISSPSNDAEVVSFPQENALRTIRTFKEN
jgi:hypothetical protein